eukprot:PhM_4_TR125/c0_g1_i2/m.71732
MSTPPPQQANNNNNNKPAAAAAAVPSILKLSWASRAIATGLSTSGAAAGSTVKQSQAIIVAVRLINAVLESLMTTTLLRLTATTPDALSEEVQTRILTIDDDDDDDENGKRLTPEIIDILKGIGYFILSSSSSSSIASSHIFSAAKHVSVWWSTPHGSSLTVILKSRDDVISMHWLHAHVLHSAAVAAVQRKFSTRDGIDTTERVVLDYIVALRWVLTSVLDLYTSEHNNNNNNISGSHYCHTYLSLAEVTFFCASLQTRLGRWDIACVLAGHIQAALDSANATYGTAPNQTTPEMRTVQSYSNELMRASTHWRNHDRTSRQSHAAFVVQRAAKRWRQAVQARRARAAVAAALVGAVAGPMGKLAAIRLMLPLGNDKLNQVPPATPSPPQKAQEEVKDEPCVILTPYQREVYNDALRNGRHLFIPSSGDVNSCVGLSAATALRGCACPRSREAIVNFVSPMVREVVDREPEDPLQFMLDWVRRKQNEDMW